MAKRGTQFQTIRTEGAILPPDILRRIASLKVDGATPDAYHLPPGSKLNEAISQSWTTLLNHWQAFQEARANLPVSDETGTAVTNERWLLPLFKELDYGRLVTTKSPVIDERSYPIERFYNHTPIHLIGCKLPLDRRTRGARGAATASPHSMVQEFINRSNEHLWAFLSNGLQLRILRDNVSLSRQAFVEFDLEAIMDGEVYADFALLWLLCHQSRVESDKAVDCWLEKWSHLAREQGTRVLNDLRVGVQKAIEALGRGFIGHPRNERLREKLRSGTLSTDEYYRQLLRTVYRLLFLFVAEDRELLHPPDADAAACDLYATHYSTRRLRELAHKIRGSKHADLWHSLSLVFDALGRNEGRPELGLCGLGSFLWRPSSTADLLGPLQANGEASLITNDDLLQAIRALAYVEQDRVLRIVDYRNLGSEELGSVYESLLELHPVMNAEAKAFELSTAAGNERKTTGSYYTPDSLVQCLLDSALDPVVTDRLKGRKGEEAEQAILAMKVCDPACGSGHFLIAAAHRLARHLARIRTGDTEPSPDDYQHALRDVIGRCVYGVDLNPMAVELCKVSLWMEAIEPGKPLSFLDHHIQCGNSLLGTTPVLLAKGIPDNAFKPIEGDVREVVNSLKRDNKRERADYKSGQGYLFSPTLKLGNLPSTIAKINSGSDESLEDIAAKQAMYETLVKGADYLSARLLADTWCSAFIWRKDDSDLGRLCPTERGFRSIEENPHSVNVHVKAEVLRLTELYQFFHWHLAFPDVFYLPTADSAPEQAKTGWNGGFDVMLGNPPWDRVKPEPTKYFAASHPEIANAANAAARERLIDALRESHPSDFERWKESERQTLGTAVLLTDTNSFPLTGQGKYNLGNVFIELSSNRVSEDGRVGMLNVSGLVTDDSGKEFTSHLLEDRRLVSFYDFENSEGLFPGVHRSYKFSAVTLSGRSVSEPTDFVFFARSVSELDDASRHVRISLSDIALLNPMSRNCPVFRSSEQAELVKTIYRRANLRSADSRVLYHWDAEPSFMFVMSDHSHLFLTEGDVRRLGGFPYFCEKDDERSAVLRLYESKMFHHFDHRWGSFENGDISDVPATKKVDPKEIALPRYWMKQNDANDKLSKIDAGWMLAIREVTNATNERTSIATVLPTTALGHNAQFFCIKDSASNACAFLANLNSFAFDYATRTKVGGSHLSSFILRQLPVLPKSAFADSMFEQSWFSSRVLELTFTAEDLRPFADDCGYDGPPFLWDEGRRFLLRCELDAAFFHLYLGAQTEWGEGSRELTDMFDDAREAVAFIMESFPIVKRKDIANTEVKNAAGDIVQKGRYVTKDTILQLFDEMSAAFHAGRRFISKIDPPPGPPLSKDGTCVPWKEWNRHEWPSNIHKCGVAKT